MPNLNSQFENDFSVYECFENEFGKNNLKKNKKGDIITKKI